MERTYWIGTFQAHGRFPGKRCIHPNITTNLYAKLPGWFTVPTPLGSYNPDWVVLIEADGAERLYFVVETKSSLFASDLRGKEADKIDCAKARFEALRIGESPARYLAGRSVDDLLTAASE